MVVVHGINFPDGDEDKLRQLIAALQEKFGQSTMYAARIGLNFALQAAEKNDEGKTTRKAAGIFAQLRNIENSARLRRPRTLKGEPRTFRLSETAVEELLRLATSWREEIQTKKGPLRWQPVQRGFHDGGRTESNPRKF